MGPRAAPQGGRGGGGLKGGVEAAAVGGTGGWRAVSRVRPPPPGPPPSYVIGQIFLRAFGQSKLCPGAFGASQSVSQSGQKNCSVPSAPLATQGLLRGRGVPPHSPPPPPGPPPLRKALHAPAPMSPGGHVLWGSSAGVPHRTPAERAAGVRPNARP